MACGTAQLAQCLRRGVNCTPDPVRGNRVDILARPGLQVWIPHLLKNLHLIEQAGQFVAAARYLERIAN